MEKKQKENLDRIYFQQYVVNAFKDSWQREVNQIILHVASVNTARKVMHRRHTNHALLYAFATTAQSDLLSETHTSVDSPCKFNYTAH